MPKPIRSTWLLAALILGGPAGAQAETTRAPTPAATGSSSGLPLPRFVSLKSDRVNMRSGAGQEFPTLWVYRRAGLPLEVIQEVEGWRQVRDAEGATGWIVQSMLSGRRTVLVLPWEVRNGAPPPQVPLKADDRHDAADVAIVEAGVIANIASCDGKWCRVSVGELRGYVEQAKLWGVYKNERVR